MSISFSPGPFAPGGDSWRGHHASRTIDHRRGGGAVNDQRQYAGGIEDPLNTLWQAGLFAGVQINDPLLSLS